MQSLIIASHNQGKVHEIAELLRALSVNVRSSAELGLPEPEETGASFSENASLKAREAMHASQLPALADDSGLVIPALDGAPGIYSARWAGPDKDFNLAFERIKQELTEKGTTLTTPAYFICVLCLAIPGRKEALFEGKIEGHLTFPPRGEKGFGYDPIFIPDHHNQTFAEMDAQAKQSISHRARAFAKLKTYMEQKEYL